MPGKSISRSQAHARAVRAGVSCFQTRPHRLDRGFWEYVDMPGAFDAEALAWAAGKDYVSWVEKNFKVKDDTTSYVAVLVITCTPAELPDNDLVEIKANGWRIEPITPSLFEPEKQRATGDTVSAARIERAKSTAESPVKIVWDICARLGNPSKEQVVAEAAALGVNPSTAGTQFYKWRKANKG